MTIYINRNMARCSPADLCSTLKEREEPELKALANLLCHSGTILAGRWGPEGFIECYVDGLQSQCGTLVAYGWTVRHPEDKIIEEFKTKLITLAKGLTYSTILATMPSKDNVSCELLKTIGFQQVKTFVNNRTNNENHIYVLDL